MEAALSVKPGTEVVGALTVHDVDDDECSLRSPNVRAYVASFEMQQQQHRPLCRTDDVGKLRPNPPCKTTTAVLKARHLRAASDDLSRSWKTSDKDLAESAVASRSVAELKMALFNSATCDQNGRGHDSSENDIIFRLADDYRNGNVSDSFECKDNEIERLVTGKKNRHASSGDSAADCSPRPSSGDERWLKPATDGGVDVVDSTGDDAGYFSLPDRRPDKEFKHQTSRCRSQSYSQTRHRSSAVDDNEVDCTLTYSSDSAGSLSPGPRTSGDDHPRADATSSLGSGTSEDEHFEGPRYRTDASPRTCSDPVITDDHSSISNVTASGQHLDEVVAAEVGQQKSHVEDRPVVPWRNSTVPSSSEKLTAARLSTVLVATFGSCDEVLCHAVDVVDSYRTTLDYVADLFAESRLIRPCAFDLSIPCQLDATSSCVQFLTVEAVREAARQHITQERDVMQSIKETTNNDEGLLKQLDSRVMDVIERKTDSRQLEKYRQYVDEMERVTRLLLLLAGRLARLDNSVLHLPPSGDSQPTTPRSLTTNRDELVEKFADASALKCDIDRRGRTISEQLTSCLSAEEFDDYRRLMAEKTRLRLQRQETEDWLRLAEQQLGELSADSVDHLQDFSSNC